MHPAEVNCSYVPDYPSYRLDHGGEPLQPWQHYSSERATDDDQCSHTFNTEQAEDMKEKVGHCTCGTHNLQLTELAWVCIVVTGQCVYMCGDR